MISLSIKQYQTAVFMPLWLSAQLLANGNALAAGHYPVGVEGIKSATLPGPGKYYRIYNVYYMSDDFKDANGSRVPIDFDVDAYVHAHRFIHVTERKILGADYFWNFALPLVYTDITVGNEDDSKVAIGDLFIEPLGLAWHGKNYDTVAALAVYLPVGSSGDLADPGKDYYTLMAVGGATYYFGEDNAWSFSLTSRYEMHSEQDNTDITPGDDFHIEGGLGRDDGLWTYGISGYAQWQVTDDDNDANPELEDVHDRVYAIGPEVARFFPGQKILLNLKAHQEFGAEDLSEGTKVTLTFTKIF